MCVTRRPVLRQLAEATDAERRETTTVDALASTLGVDERSLEAHIDALVACELAHVEADGSVRATITAEELLALDTGEVVIVDLTGRDGDADA
jgi:DNA-binding transcriptional ArsR family regulator